MRKQLRMSWQRVCRLIMISRPFGKSLRDKAIAVAGRVTVKKDGMSLKASCPVCLEIISTPLDSDLKMTLAVHMSLWHPDDVQLHWEMMQNKGRSIVHMPSFCFGVGTAAGIGALIVFLARSHARAFGNKR
ncbi:PREDICTED: uncharacterized protein LOC109223045 [Nicotiana attenuata]|uniref:Uncharacterized protein n=1 Tax=Nicotiana attenuata TaxID=49451 RepID=A0A1J6JI89_NICAT|nr:PREDICTED: uncharacterized protein LOC109223045 [Nicotiana attenuata]XP_019242853.1 PREDICTED: uncharacterized protein LOC109223045 [Nicotiana attenuata]XP_019242854.1 PREDICTED: uncharacterized protein LOC109223045 [Nicotiana attenuata]XP_019242855.1 PREDICTED: uncharacterized protein LOC109223045 [Nicotiana attenuata]OIT06689.1 hypothetical protein A4A49_23996 [Nicotiana attenuata]